MSTVLCEFVMIWVKVVDPVRLHSLNTGDSPPKPPAGYYTNNTHTTRDNVNTRLQWREELKQTVAYGVERSYK